MKGSLALALLIGGVALMVLGINATNSVCADISRFFTGTPTSQPVWMVIGGFAASVIGLVFVCRNWKQA